MSSGAIKLAVVILTSLLISLNSAQSSSPGQLAGAAELDRARDRETAAAAAGSNEEAEERLTRLLLAKFVHLFPKPELDEVLQAETSSAQLVTPSPSLTRPFDSMLINKQAESHQESMVKFHSSNAAGSPLETRNDEVLAASVEPDSFKKRSYFRVVDHVFSRIELPQVFRSPKASSNSYCANFIGCIDDIPGLPAILRRSNISSTFTVYTSARPKGVRIPYEPLQHHQLGDVNLTAMEIASRLQLQKQQQQQLFLHKQQQQQQLSNHIQQQQHHQMGLHQSPFQQQILGHQQQLLAVKPRPLNPAKAQNGPPGSRRTSSKVVSAKSWQSASILKRVQEYPFDLSALESSGFKASENTRVIIGGYFAKEDEHWIEDLVDLWRQLEPSANIIKVSWPDANRGLYHSAALNSRVVGRQLSLFLHYLDQMFSIDLARFHLVGHSLGAHIAGFVGADNAGKIGRITGLDPAGPIFVDMDEAMRLDPNDAHFVDVVHTNAGSITKGALGLSTPSGHVDYYPNGGNVQPGCYSSSMAIMDPVERVACNHRRSYRYFIEILRLTIEQQNSSGNEQQQQQLTGGALTTTPATPGQSTHSPAPPTTTFDPVLASSRAVRRQRQAAGGQAAAAASSIRPTAFLFEAKDDELDRLSQPELLCLDSKLLQPRHRSDECELNDLPARRLIEFHNIKVDFPAGRRGLYYLRTRPEAPFFGGRQYGVTLRSANALKRKISISMRLDRSLLPEFELEQIDSSLTLLFVPTELNGRFNLSADLWFMWRYKSFTLLSSQPDELSLSGLELLELESSPTPSVIKYCAPNASQPVFSSNSLRRAGGATGSNEWPALVRNRWYKFERS